MAISNYLLFSKPTSSNGCRSAIQEGGYKGFADRMEAEGIDLESYDCLLNAIKSFPQSES